MNQVVSHQPVTWQAHVHSQVSPSEICGGQSGTGTGFPRSTSGSPCQHHSTNAPYTFVHSPVTDTI